MSLDALLAPLGQDAFLREVYGRKPLHLPRTQTSERAIPLDWSRLSGLLGIRTHWHDANIKLLLNSRPVLSSLYMDSVDRAGGAVTLANPAKVRTFLAMGASLVANSVEDISPDLREITSLLGRSLGGRAGANVYCSFEGIQAFASHCDLHEVFALQCEGEKVWKIYENRAAAPVDTLSGPDAQQIIDGAKGRVAMEVRLRPGDLLYIPRGFYHDALASSAASLHVTFSVTPLTARGIFRILEEFAVEDADFREYLADARTGDGAALGAQLASLSAKVAALMQSSRFRTRLAADQQKLWEPNQPVELPALPKLEFYARTGRPGSVDTTEDGAYLQGGGPDLPLGLYGDAAEWMINRSAFSLQELFASFPYLDESAVRKLVAELQRRSLIQPYTPQL